ncbi:hypothetical protein VTL71DRAFT_8836 [Oculimacula yallundae]|uniref:Uncharacterized protein n=1 Tax=Oculimacula yallundae TaxID=86028 RepID=A0ABR4CYW7_9HELO
MLSILASMFFATAVLRPSISPELIQLMNDVVQYTAIIDAQSVVMQDLGTAYIILRCSSPNPIFPRWVGPYAWSGIIGFWIPSMVFGNDLCMIAWQKRPGTLLARYIMFNGR